MVRILIRRHKIRLLYARRPFYSAFGRRKRGEQTLGGKGSSSVYKITSGVATVRIDSSAIGCWRRWQQHRQSLNPVVISKYETFKVSQHWANTHSVEKDKSFCVSFELTSHL
ncbi:unnamed protein product [Brassica oleracea var. botrytis]